MVPENFRVRELSRPSGSQGCRAYDRLNQAILGREWSAGTWQVVGIAFAAIAAMADNSADMEAGVDMGHDRGRSLSSVTSETAGALRHASVLRLPLRVAARQRPQQGRQWRWQRWWQRRRLGRWRAVGALDDRHAHTLPRWAWCRMTVADWTWSSTASLLAEGQALCCDATLVSPVSRDGLPQGCLADEDEAAAYDCDKNIADARHGLERLGRT